MEQLSHFTWKGNAIAVLAVSEEGTMFDPGICVYMEKIAVGPSAKGLVDINFYRLQKI